ncbi:MAG TPA: DUF427 domain-containing protein [Anaeromyxobacteraceae bacterium]|nr:DUF427 domain-containing protein [Anaeromyxobacteraceae bacterium]
MARATWNGAVLAESDDVELVEGNVYFPPGSVRREHLRESPTHTVCGWKGRASYYDLEVAGKRNPDAAWYYPEPKEAASHIAGHVSFWHGVVVER